MVAGKQPACTYPMIGHGYPSKIPVRYSYFTRTITSRLAYTKAHFYRAKSHYTQRQQASYDAHRFPKKLFATISYDL